MTILLDGGMGGEIQSRLPQAKNGLWSALALIDCPQLVSELHREYIDAGADVIATNTYATIPSYLGKAGVAARYEELTRQAAQLARAAADESARPVQVAGALPPLEESYRPDLVPPAAEAAPVYAALVKAMAGQVDVWLCETMSSAAEGVNAAQQARQLGGGKPVWVAWTLNETPGAGLRSGESIATAVRAVEDLDVDAFLFNCTHPEAIEAGLAELRTLTDKPIGCYPNRLNRVPANWALDGNLVTGRRRDLPQEVYVAAIERSIELGAEIVGGCCGIGPSDIKAVAQRLRQATRTG